MILIKFIFFLLHSGKERYNLGNNIILVKAGVYEEKYWMAICTLLWREQHERWEKTVIWVTQGWKGNWHEDWPNTMSLVNAKVVCFQAFLF